MEFAYTLKDETAHIDKVLDPGPVVEIPASVEGCPVTVLGAYALAGSPVEELYLPSCLDSVGAYACYNCDRLKHLSCYGRTLDLGTGVFAGIRGPGRLDITVAEGEKSCLPELLSELRQTLRVRLRVCQGQATGQPLGQPTGQPLGQPTGQPWDQAQGQPRPPFREARLIFPEYFEESVENTSARILFIETHGCGHRYRYCFVNTQLQFRDYDELFPHVQVQEQEELVTELALGRLLYPLGLLKDKEAMYREYVGCHWQTAGKLLLEADRPAGEALASNLDPGGLPWLAEGFLDGPDQVGTLANMAQAAGNTEMVGWLMDFGHRKFGRGRSGGSLPADGGAAPTRLKPARKFEL